MNSIISFFLDWKVKLAIVLFVLAGAFTYHKFLVHEAVQEAVAEIQTQQTKENFRLKERSLDTKIALQESFDKIQKEKDAKIISLNSRVASLTLSLQQRPSRAESSGVSDDSKAGEVRPEGTGLGLYRQDGLFLAREAARADALRIALGQCQTQYNAARDALK